MFKFIEELFYIGDPEGGYDYTRGGNPTRTSLQSCIAKLENANFAFVFSSGMAATSTVVQALLHSGNRILTINDLYAGSNRFVLNCCNFILNIKRINLSMLLLNSLSTLYPRFRPGLELDASNLLSECIFL